MYICMCGAQAGYPHDRTCPYPYYGRDVKQESAWLDACEKKAAQLQPGAVVPEIEVINAEDIDPDLFSDIESQLLSAELDARGDSCIVLCPNDDHARIADEETLKVLDAQWNKATSA